MKVVAAVVNGTFDVNQCFASRFEFIHVCSILVPGRVHIIVLFSEMWKGKEDLSTLAKLMDSAASTY